VKDMLTPKIVKIHVKRRFVETEEVDGSSNKHAHMDVT